MREFLIYQGSGTPDADGQRIRRRAAPPPWREFAGGPPMSFHRDAPAGRRLPDRTRTAPYRFDTATVRMVNVALHLRRPLLITGDPGAGKTTLAYAVAHELRLGTVLRWSIISRSTLASGLYHYDAVGRIEEATTRPQREAPDISRFLRLGPLGTAFAPYDLPRVLLIDEIDKGDIDLPNELLDVFEEGEYGISELERIADATPRVRVRPADDGDPVTIVDGQVRCHEFPFIVMTSNGEREFPAPFLRRCIRVTVPQPSLEDLQQIVKAHLTKHLTGVPTTSVDAMITTFIQQREGQDIATDQLLNAAYLVLGDGRSNDEQPESPQANESLETFKLLVKQLTTTDAT
jgi:MoxR-like ATPase